MIETIKLISNSQLDGVAARDDLNAHGEGILNCDIGLDVLGQLVD
jgi:hypothetical protein